MSEQLGKIERPAAERFKMGRKLYLVPLVYCGEDSPDDFRDRCNRYWQQAAEQLANLASKIGKVRRVYHESVFRSGADGLKVVERLNQGSHDIARTHCDEGASFEAVEEEELFGEYVDWQRCLMLGLGSEAVASKVARFYVEAVTKRNESMAGKIAQTLGEDEEGLLFIQEGHSVQFPADIEVFSVFPPALDDIHRWLRDRARPGTEKVARKSEEGSKRETGETKKKARKGARTGTKA